MDNSLFVDVAFSTRRHGTYGEFKASRIVESFDKEYIDRIVDYVHGIVKNEDYATVDFITFDGYHPVTITRVIKQDGGKMDTIDFTGDVKYIDHGKVINKRNIRKFVNASVASFCGLEQ